jgi:hypothetical protein
MYSGPKTGVVIPAGETVSLLEQLQALEAEESDLVALQQQLKVK